MFKKYFTNKVGQTEGIITLLFIIWFAVAKNGDQSGNSNLIINLMFLVLLATMFIYKSSNHRHMLFAFIFLMLSVIADIFGLSSIVFLTSSLTLSLLILGGLNMIIFKDKNL